VSYNSARYRTGSESHIPTFAGTPLFYQKE
jgi:hypothetical protein